MQRVGAHRKSINKAMTKVAAKGQNKKRDAILRARKALDDLRTNPFEVGQLLSKSGRLSKTVTQNNKFHINYIFNGKRAAHKASATLHNHPNPFPKLKLSTLPPSSKDIKNSLRLGNYGLVASVEGTNFRYSRGKRFDRAGEFETMALRQKVEGMMEKFEDRIKKIKDITPDQVFLTQDRMYQRLNKQGLLRYRVRPTPEVAARRKQFQSNADRLLDWIFRD